METRKTRIIYRDEAGYAWIGGHGIGAPHDYRAQLWSEIPKNDSPKWIDGKPTEKDIQFLTLSPFFPSGQLDVEIEIRRSSQRRHVNHEPFYGCKKYMRLDSLDFRLIPK